MEDPKKCELVPDSTDTSRGAWSEDFFAVFQNAGRASDEALSRAVSLYFIEPRGDRLDAVARFLSADSQELLRQSMLVVEAANAVLDDEGRRLALLFAQKGRPVVCRSGCCGCCCQLVLCQPFEAALIAAYLVAHPPALVAFVASYPLWDAATSAFRGQYLRWAQRVYGKGVDDGAYRIQDYFVRCPFLDASDCCGIYPVRPYCCRSSISLDPACAFPAAGELPGLRNFPFSLHTSHHESRRAVVALLRQRLEEASPPVPMPELVRGLLPNVLGHAGPHMR